MSKTGPKPVSDEQARIEAREAGLEPLGPYPGATTGRWRHRCRTCGGDCSLPLSKIRSGHRCGHRRGEVEQKRTEILREAAFSAVGEYPGKRHQKWRLRCDRCGREMEFTLARVKKGTAVCQCVFVKEMREGGYEPQADYPGTARAPWPSVCITCKQPRKPSLTTVRQGGRCGHGESWWPVEVAPPEQ